MSSLSDVERKRGLSNKVSRLTKRECVQLLKIFKSHDIKVTENFNGCYINIGSLEGDILDEVAGFIDMCFEVHNKNKMREEQIKKYEEEFEASPIMKTFRLDSSPYENAQLTAIKNDKHLNSLEKSIMTENLKNSLSDKAAVCGKKSLTPKYTGARARLLKSCRLINRSSSGAGPLALPDGTVATPDGDSLNGTGEEHAYIEKEERIILPQDDEGEVEPEDRDDDELEDVDEVEDADEGENA